LLAPSVVCAGFSQRPSEEFPTETPHLRVASCRQPLVLNNNNNYNYYYNNNSNNNDNIYERLTSTKSVELSAAVLVGIASGMKSVFQKYCFISLSGQFQTYRFNPQSFQIAATDILWALTLEFLCFLVFAFSFFPINTLFRLHKLSWLLISFLTVHTSCIYHIVLQCSECSNSSTLTIVTTSDMPLLSH